MPLKGTREQKPHATQATRLVTRQHISNLLFGSKISIFNKQPTGLAVSLTGKKVTVSLWSDAFYCRSLSDARISDQTLVIPQKLHNFYKTVFHLFLDINQVDEEEAFDISHPEEEQNISRVIETNSSTANGTSYLNTTHLVM